MPAGGLFGRFAPGWRKSSTLLFLLLRFKLACSCSIPVIILHLYTETDAFREAFWSFGSLSRGLTFRRSVTPPRLLSLPGGGGQALLPFVRLYRQVMRSKLRKTGISQAFLGPRRAWVRGSLGGVKTKKVGPTYSPAGEGSTLGGRRFHGSVRDGKRWFTPSLGTLWCFEGAYARLKAIP